MRSIADGETFAMASGEQVALADRSTLRYVRVTNDSRCKPGRQCVWAGDAEVVFEWTADAAGAPESFSLRSEEHTSELQSLMRISYAVFCLKKKRYQSKKTTSTNH